VRDQLIMHRSVLLLQIKDMSMKRLVVSLCKMKKLGVCRVCIYYYFGNYVHADHLELVADSFETNA
jgi:hypothetical protein